MAARAWRRSINVFGGKITTYRRLAESMLEKIEHLIGKKGKPWTGTAALPGGDFPVQDFDAEVAAVRRAYPFLAQHLAHRLMRLYGTRVRVLLGNAKSMDDLGRNFGAELYEAEVRYLIAHEWARTAEDILWRRTKRGLKMSREEAAGLETFLQDIAPDLQTAAE
jgi:glycerol-3-phosphate dehydrogenase